MLIYLTGLHVIFPYNHNIINIFLIPNKKNLKKNSFYENENFIVEFILYSKNNNFLQNFLEQTSDKLNLPHI